MEKSKDFFDAIEHEAHDSEIECWGCSQAVLYSLQKNFNIGNVNVFGSASALAGGVAAEKEVCGALLGAIMAIGLMYGRERFEEGTIARESEEYLEARARTIKLCEGFRNKFGSLRCGDVWVNVRGSDYKEYKGFDSVEALEDHDKCGEVTGATARMAAEILLQPTEDFRDEMNAMAEEVAEARKMQKKGRRVYGNE